MVSPSAKSAFTALICSTLKLILPFKRASSVDTTLTDAVPKPTAVTKPVSLTVITAVLLDV